MTSLCCGVARNAVGGRTLTGLTGAIGCARSELTESCDGHLGGIDEPRESLDGLMVSL